MKWREGGLARRSFIKDMEVRARQPVFACPDCVLSAARRGEASLASPAWLSRLSGFLTFSG